MTKRVPKWMTEHAAKCKRAFGLGYWSIDVRLRKRLRYDGGPARGLHTTSYRTLESMLDFHEGILNTEREAALSVVTHEFLHVALIEYQIATRRIISFVPKAHRAHCTELHLAAMERTVEGLARSLTPVLMTVQEGKE